MVFFRAGDEELAHGPSFGWELNPTGKESLSAQKSVVDEALALGAMDSNVSVGRPNMIGTGDLTQYLKSRESSGRYQIIGPVVAPKGEQRHGPIGWHIAVDEPVVGHQCW